MKNLKRREEVQDRDHVKLGSELDLFVTDKNVGKGLPLLTPKGTAIKRALQKFVEDEELKRGYRFTATPYLAKSDLYEISGHWDHYRNEMFVMGLKDGREILALRPMTCPFHFVLYNRKTRSFRELPLRYAETSVLFRNELSGAMHGLIRTRQFTLSEGHIVCLPSQLEDEFIGVLELIDMVLRTLELDDYSYRLSKWDPNKPEKYIDDPEMWERSQTVLKRILDKTGLEYVEAEDEAAFYGPKLDIQMKNVWGKEDTIITLQIDFALPERFGMTYIDPDGNRKTPMVIHRSSIGCYERTMALLIERYAGRFPFWLAPEQVRILTLNNALDDYAGDIEVRLLSARLRVSLD
ncbi:MAG: threonine--tRNA ligase, partial [Proteobacteria bacterium]|nr:threonine--tRNA ligase [Pseudomonadota bacterium]